MNKESKMPRKKNHYNLGWIFLYHVPPIAKTLLKYSASNGSDKQFEKLFIWTWENNGLSVSGQMYGYDYNAIFS